MTRNQRDLPTWCGWLAVTVAVGMMAAVGWGSSAPLFRADEIGNLGNAQLFANPGTTWLLAGKAYMPGMGILLTPVWLITDDPATAYRIAIAMCAVMGLLVILPLRRIAKHFGAAPVTATILAALVVVAPSRVLGSNYVWAENLLVLLVSTTVVLLLECGPSTRFSGGVLLGAAAGATFLAHGRALPFAVGALLVAVWLLRSQPRVAASAAVTGAATLAASYVLFGYVADALYIGDDRVASTLDDIRRATPETYFASLGGQAWYQVAAWAGLTALGAIVLGGAAQRKGWRSAPAGVFALLAGMSLLVPLVIANPVVEDRGHVYFYGRYLDAFLVPLAVIGLAGIVRGVRWRSWITSLGVGTAGGLVFVLASAPKIGEGFMITPAHVPGVAYLVRVVPTDTQWPGSWALVVILSLVPAVVLAVTSRWPRVSLTLFAVWAVGVSLYSDEAKFDRFDQLYRSPPFQVDVLAAVDPAITLFGDVTSAQVQNNGNEFTFWSHPRAFVYMDTRKDTSDVVLFIADLSAPFVAQSGASPFVGSIVGDSATWVVPGTLHDQLDAQGRLLHKRSDAD